MRGPEHAQEAQRLIDAADKATNDQWRSSNLQAAQVHATLALTAATIASSENPSMPTMAWDRAFS